MAVLSSFVCLIATQRIQIAGTCRTVRILYQFCCINTNNGNNAGSFNAKANLLGWLAIRDFGKSSLSNDKLTPSKFRTAAW